MTETRRRDLSYGHLGEATYSPETGEWQFSRQPGIGWTLKPFGDPSTGLPSTLLSPTLHHVQSAATRNKQIKDLARGDPALAPAAAILPSLAQVSEAITEATSSHDALVGALITFGKATDLDNQRSGAKTVDIAAVAGGPAGEVVRLVLIGKTQLQWEGHARARLEAQTLDEREYGYWMSNGSPILQLCFSSNTSSTRESGGWLAVRCADAVTILRPLIRRSAVTAQNAAAIRRLITGYAPSRLDANPFLHLPKERNGGVPLSDVSFNPWNDHQFAVVDRKGEWSIWNIEGQDRRRNTWSLTAGPSGKLLPVENNYPENADDDGWGAVLWAGSPNTIVVANRNNLAIFNVKKRPLRLHTQDLAIPSGSDWILDINRCAYDLSYFYVLTSTFALWLRVSPDSDETFMSMQSDSAVLVSWRHYLNREDSSLRLVVDSDTEGTTMILIYSRLKDLTIGFILATSATNLPQSVSDPFLVPTSSLDPADGTRESQYGICTSTMNLRRVDLAVSPSLGSFIPEGSTFYKMFTLRNDLKVIERLYIHLPPNATIPVGKLITKDKVTALKKTSTIVTEDDFIVADGMESEEEVRYYPVRSVVKTTNKNVPRTHDEERDSSNVNFEWLARMIEIHDSSDNRSYLGTNQSTAFKSPNRYVEDLKQVGSADADSTHIGIKTLLECSTNQLTVDDLDAASEAVATYLEEMARYRLIEDDDHQTSVGRNERLNPVSCTRLLRASNPVINHESDASCISLVQVYDNLVRHWITILASDVPGRVRVAMEKRLRRIATEIYLSSYGIKGNHPGTISGEPSELSNDDDNQFILPMHGKTLRSNPPTKAKEEFRHTSHPQHQTVTSSPYSDFPLPRISLPTPAPAPSLHSQASLTFKSPPSDPASTRLKALAHLTSQPPFPDSSTRLLTHWSLGTDPALYDWESTKRRLQPRTASEAREDERIADQRRRYEKRLKRQLQRESAMGLGVGSSSQILGPTVVVSASQPDPTAVTQGPGSSQAQELSSQVGQGWGASSQRVPVVSANWAPIVKGKVGKGGKVRRKGF